MNNRPHVKPKFRNRQQYKFYKEKKNTRQHNMHGTTRQILAVALKLVSWSVWTVAIVVH